MPEVDEFGIPIKKTSNPVDEFGIPVKKKDGGSPSTVSPTPSPSALKRLEELRKQVFSNQLTPQRTELPKNIQVAKQKAETEIRQEKQAPKVTQMMVFKTPTFKVEYSDQDELTAKVLGFQNAQQRYDFEKRNKEQDQQKAQQAADEFYNTGAGKFYYNVFKPVADAGARAIRNTGATVSRILGEDEIAEAFVERFTPEKRYEGTIAGNTPTKLQGGLYNDGKISWSKLPSRIVKGFTDMAWLMAPSGMVSAGTKIPQVTSLMANSFVQSREDYYQEGKNAGLKGETLDYFATGAASLTSALEGIFPNTLALGGFKSKLVKDYAEQIAKGVTTKAAFKAFTKEVVKEAAVKETPQEVLQLAGDKVARTLTDMATGENNFGDQFDWDKTRDEFYEVLTLTPIISLAAAGSGAAKNYTPTNYEKAVFYDASKNANKVNQLLDNQYIEKKITEEQYKNAKQKFNNYVGVVNQVKNLGYSEDQSMQMAWEVFSGKEKLPANQSVIADPVLNDAFGGEIKKDKETTANNIKLIGMGIPSVGSEIDGKELSYVISSIGDKGTEIGQGLVDNIGDDVYRLDEIDVKELYEKDQEFKEYVDKYQKGSISGDALLVPAIIKDGKIIDGRGRLAEQYVTGNTKAKAFTKLNNTINENTQAPAVQAAPELSNIESIEINKSAILDNTASEVERLKTAALDPDDGVTLNMDGTKYEGGGLIVPIGSINTTQEELTPELIANFAERNKNKLSSGQTFKFGLYKFPGSNQVSIDLNIVTDPKNKDIALEFGKMAGQESLFDLSTFSNVPTGADGQNPRSFSDEQIREIGKAFEEGRMPNVFGRSKAIADELATELQTPVERALEDAIPMATKALEKSNIKFKIVDSSEDSPENRAARGNQGLFVAEDGTIIIDKSKLANEIEAGLVVWHEASHPVMNIIRNTNKSLYDKVVKGLEAAAKQNKGVADAMNWAQSQPEYDNIDTQNDEAIVETIGRINSGLIDINNLSTGLRQSLIDFVNSIAKFFGIDPILNDTDIAAFKKTVSEVADALKTGRDVSGIVGAQNVGQFQNPFVQSRVSAGDVLSNEVRGDKKVVEVAQTFEKAVDDILDPQSDPNKRITRFLKNAYEDLRYFLADYAGDTGLDWYTNKVKEFNAKLEDASDIAIEKGEMPAENSLRNKENMDTFKVVLALSSIGVNPRENVKAAFEIWKTFNQESKTFSKYQPGMVSIRTNIEDNKGGYVAPSGEIIKEGARFLDVKQKNGKVIRVKKSDLAKEFDVTYTNDDGKKVTKKLRYVKETGKNFVYRSGPTEVKIPKEKFIEQEEINDGIQGKGWTTKGNIVAINLNRLENLLADHPDLKSALDWINSKHPINELRKYNSSVPDVEGKKGKINPKGERLGSYIIGEKLGAFHQNVAGTPSELTMDLWWSRTWNRYMGTLMTKDKNGEPIIQETPRTDNERNIMREAAKIAADALGLEVHEFQAALWYLEQQMYKRMGAAVESYSFVDGINQVLLQYGKSTEELQPERYGIDSSEADQRRSDAAARAANIVYGESSERGGGQASQASVGNRAFLRTGPQAMANSITVGGEDISFVLDYVSTPSNLLGLIQPADKSNQFFDFNRDVRKPVAKQLENDLEFWSKDLANRTPLNKDGDISSVKTNLINKAQDRVDALQTALDIWNNNAFSLADVSVNKAGQASVGNRDMDGMINWEKLKPGKGDPKISSRNPIVTKAAADLKAGKITNEEYRAVASENSPIRPITKFFEPATKSEIKNALSSDKLDKIDTPIQDGSAVGIRLDIPAFKNNNTWVVSVHEGNTNAGKSISYTNVARITDVNFGLEPKAGLKIAAGESKSTIGRIFGKWQNLDGANIEDKGETAKKIIQDAVGNPDWVQVGFNPFRHSYFYDRSSDMGRPIVSADEVVQIGGLVYAKKPVYGNWTDESYRVKGLFDKAGAPVQFSVGNRPELSREFKVAAFVMRKKGEGESDADIVAGVSSATGMSADEVRSIIADPEAYIRKSFPELSKIAQDNLIERANIQNIYRGHSTPINPAFTGVEVPREKVIEFLNKTNGRDKQFKETVKDFKNKWLNPARGLPDWVMAIKDFSAGSKNIEIARAVKTIERLKDEAKKIGFTDWDAFSKAMVAVRDIKRVIPDEDGVTVFDPYRAAAGRMFTTPDDMLPAVIPDELKAIPESLRPFAVQMRQQIDGITKDLIGSGYVTPEQAVTLEQNLGQYVNRSYKMFNERGYKPTPEQIEEATKFIADQKIKQILSELFPAGKPSRSEAVSDFKGNVIDPDNVDMAGLEQQALEEANKDVKAILNKNKNPYFNQKIDSRDTGILKQKKDIPAPIRKLMGEYTDPGTVFVMTVAKQAALKAQSEYLTKLREFGMGTLFFEKNDPKRPAEFSVQVAADGTESKSPLGGLYTTPEIAEALEMADPTYNNLTQLWMKLVGAVRWGKTVGSVTTQAKNFESNLGFAVLNGLLMTGNNTEAFKGAAKYVKGQYSKQEIDDVTEKLIKLNLVGQSVGARELAEMLGTGDIHDVALDIAANPNSVWGKKVKKSVNVISALNKAYRMGDDFWKAYAYLNERQVVAQGRFKNKYEDLTTEQQEKVDIEASERVKNTWPTYDRVVEGAKFVSKRAPIFGNFISFQAESLRVLVNSVKMAREDMKDPEMRSAGVKRMVGIASYAAIRAAVTTAVAQAAGMAASGLLGAVMGDDEEEQKKRALKKALPVYARTADIAAIPNSKEPHKYTVFSLSSLDPYGIIPNSLNALTEGREGIFSKEMEPGVPAALAEFFSGFLEPEMTFTTMYSVLNNINPKTGRPIVTGADTSPEIAKKVSSFIIDQLEPSTISLIERGIERGWAPELASFAGARPIDVDLHKSFGYILSDMSKQMDAISSEYGNIKRNEDIPQAEKDEAEKKAEAKKAFLISKTSQVYRDFIKAGANPKVLDDMINERSPIKMTGFDKATKKGIKTGDVKSENLFK